MPRADAAAPRWAHRESYAGYFARLAAAPDAAAALRRLIPHLDAALDGAEHVALWRALWHTTRRLPGRRRDAAAACLDGRHAPALALLHLPWDAPELVEALAAATRPDAARARLLPELLAHHGLDPLADPGIHRPGLVLLAVRAALHAAEPRLDGRSIERLQAAVMSAAERDPSTTAQGLALLFELALHARDDDTAGAVLAELMRHGQAHLVRRDRVRGWLDGTACDDGGDSALPLQLAPALQQGWLQPAAWAQPAALRALHAALLRPAPRHRLESLAALLFPRGFGTAAPPASPNPAATEALRALCALDSAYALIEQGGNAEPAMRELLDPATLAPAAIAAIHLGSLRWHAAQGDREGQALALAQARRHRASAETRRRFAELLPGPAPSLGADWRDEEPYWQGLLQHDDPAWRRLAAFQLATLWTEGRLEPEPPRRCQRLEQARPLWSALAAHPAYAAAARAALDHPLQTLVHPALRHHAGVDYLWFDCPGADALTIVFSCVATHHTFAEVAALHGRMAGQHLMFVRCPDKDWYSDRTWDETHALLRSLVLPRFPRSAVSCWYGSMGGHGALKFALEFGWRAIVFNPQTDLDLWAAFRPRERALLWAAQRHARPADWPLTSWQRMPLYYACGAATPDREALGVVIDRLRRCTHATAIIEKFDDPDHAGLMNRIAGGPVAGALSRIGRRLSRLEQERPQPEAQALTGTAVAAFWRELDAARAVKVEIQLRDGRLFWQPSRHCGTPG